MSEVAYRHSDAEVAQVADAALDYIRSGEASNRPYMLRGLCVFGVIKVLRENDAEFQKYTDERSARFQEVVASVDAAVGHDMQYHPFGHKDRRKFEPDKRGCDYRQRGVIGKSSC